MPTRGRPSCEEVSGAAYACEMDWADISVVPTALIAILGVLQAFSTELKRAEVARELAVLQSDLKRAELVATRQEEVRERLNRQREPLIEAVDDLTRRLTNIIDGAFLAYLDDSDPHRREMAELSTLYRFGKYFAAVEELRRGYDAWTLEQAEETRGVERAIEGIAEVLASDSYPDFMVWRDEQRAIGELMTDRATCAPIGFAEFVTRVEADLAKWFAPMLMDITAVRAGESLRLRRLREELSVLRERLQNLRDQASNHGTGNNGTRRSRGLLAVLRPS